MSRHEIRKTGWKHTIILFTIILIIFFLYAFVRYVVFRGVGAEHIPLYILNKALALTSVAMIGASFLIGPFARIWPTAFSKKIYLRKYFGVFGFGIAAIHVMVSMLMFTPAYYPNLFDQTGKLTLDGEFSMLFGVLAVFVFSIVSVTSLPSVEKTMHKKQWLFVQRSGYIAFVLVMFHAFVMGYKSWMNIPGWPGSMPPLTLLAVVIVTFIILLMVLVMLYPRKKK